MSLTHQFDPIYNSDSKILILGTFPSVKSREIGLYYGHPRNRFWKLLSDIFNDNMPNTFDEKTNFLLKHNIALWDVIKSCDISGSSDSSIKNVIVNDLCVVLDNSNIQTIITNGKKAEELYQKYQYSFVDIDSICLPSTSPANASCNYDRLFCEWSRILRDI